MKWMSWEGGVELIALSSNTEAGPNIIVQLARMVHTPVGSAPAGMLLVPGTTAAHRVKCFISPDKKVGDYFGSNILPGTPFENAPTCVGSIDVFVEFPHFAEVRVKFDHFEAELALTDLGEMQRVSRENPNLPFYDASLEAPAGKAELTVNRSVIDFILPPVGFNGGCPAVYSPAGIYSRP